MANLLSTGALGWNKNTHTIYIHVFAGNTKLHNHSDSVITRRLAACTQAVIILRSISYIAIELKCSAFEDVRNSIESMYSSYSAFDCISWNRLIAYYSFTDLKHVKWVKIVLSAYECFSLYLLAFAVERHLNFRVRAVRDIELP